MNNGIRNMKPINLPYTHDCKLHLTFDIGEATVEVRSLIDTGADLSFIDEKLYKSIITNISSEVTHCKPVFNTFVQACGDTGEISNCVYLPVTLAGVANLKIRLHVVPKLTAKIILGRDFLTETKSHIDFSTQTITLHKPYFPEKQYTGTPDTHNHTLLTTMHGKSVTQTQEESKPHKEPMTTPSHEMPFKPQLRNANTIPTARQSHSSPPDIPPEWTDGINKALPVHQQEQIAHIMQQNKEAFVPDNKVIGRGELPEMKVNLRPDARPVYTRPYRINPKLQTRVDEILQNYVDQKVIEPAQSEFNSPLVVVYKQQNRSHKHQHQKKDKIRIVLDLREVNKQVLADIRSVPNVQDLLDKILLSYDKNEQPNFFTSLDLTNMYYQLPLHPDSRDLTAFSWKQSQWRFCRVPQGLKISAGHANKVMAKVLEELRNENVLAYMDDLMIHSRTFEEHLQTIDKVLKALSKHKLLLAPQKCQFACSKINFLGFEFTSKGYSPAQKHIKALQSYPAPKTIKEVRNFLGLINFFKAFIPQRPQLCQPLNALTKKNAVFEWTNECQESFDKLKAILCAKPTLHLPRFTQQFHLFTDASLTGIAGVLTQQDDKGNFQPVAYCGRSLTPAEKNYSISRLELLAMVYSIQYFKVYLLASRFHVYTDHSALKSIFKCKRMTPQLARYTLFLQGFDFEIHYKPGLLNAAPDAISRIPHAKSRTEEDKIIDSFPSEPPLMENSEITEEFQDKDDVIVHTLNALQKQVDDRLHGKSLIGLVDLSQDFERMFNQTSVKRERLTDSNKKGSTRNPIPTGKPVKVVILPQTLKTEPSIQTVEMSHHNYNLRPRQSEGMKVLKQTGERPEANRADNDKINKTKGTQAEVEPNNNRLDHKEIIEAQSSDPLIKSISSFITHNDTKQLPRQVRRNILRHARYCTLINGILYRKAIKCPDKYSIQQWKLFVPSSLRTKILKMLHNSQTSVHFGLNKTRKLAAAYYYWPSMTRDIQKYIASCHICLAAKRSQNKLNPPLQEFEVPNQPGIQIHADLVGPLTLSSQKYQYIAVIVDSFSKFVTAFPMRHKTSEEFLKGFYKHYICLFGIPHSLHTDQGMEFCSNMAKELYKSFGISHTHTSGYNPKSNGKVERVNQVIINLLRTAVHDEGKKWDAMLHHIVFHMNCSVHTTTKHTPFLLTFGRTPQNVPRHDVKVNVQQNTQSEFVKELLEHQARLYKTVRSEIQDASKLNKERYDKHAKEPNVQIGSTVYLYTPTADGNESNKFAWHFKGPYTVTALVDHDRVRMKDTKTGVDYPNEVHMSRLKHSQHYNNNKEGEQ